jgi:hypothetical protein
LTVKSLRKDSHGYLQNISFWTRVNVNLGFRIRNTEWKYYSMKSFWWIIDADEEISPTFEEMILLTCLYSWDARLPRKVRSASSSLYLFLSKFGSKSGSTCEFGFLDKPSQKLCGFIEQNRNKVTDFYSSSAAGERRTKQHQ